MFAVHLLSSSELHVNSKPIPRRVGECGFLALIVNTLSCDLWNHHTDSTSWSLWWLSGSKQSSLMYPGTVGLWFFNHGCQPNLPIRISSTTTSNDTELNINCTYFKHLYDFIAKVNLSIIVLKCPFILFSKFIHTMFRRILELIHSPINLLQLPIQSTEYVSTSCEIGVIQYVVSSSRK